MSGSGSDSQTWLSCSESLSVRVSYGGLRVYYGSMWFKLSALSGPVM